MNISKNSTDFSVDRQYIKHVKLDTMKLKTINVKHDSSQNILFNLIKY